MCRTASLSSPKLHLPSALGTETCCGLPLAGAALGAYAGHTDARGHWHSFIFDIEGRPGFACKGCLSIYERQQFAKLLAGLGAA